MEQPTTSQVKLFVMFLGALAVTLGLHSHFSLKGNIETCHNLKKQNKVEFCPDITFEIIYLTVSVSAFALSAFHYLVNWLWNVDNSSWRTFTKFGSDFHAAMYVGLLASSIMYIIISTELNPITVDDDTYRSGVLIFSRTLRNEQIAAGAISILQSCLHGATALVTYKNALMQKRVIHD